jgi:hypothetical protein
LIPYRLKNFSAISFSPITSTLSLNPNPPPKMAGANFISFGDVGQKQAFDTGEYVEALRAPKVIGKTKGTVLLLELQKL